MTDTQIMQKIDEAMKLGRRQALEEVRAEIERKANSGQWSEATVYGMQKSITIIDKHLQEGGMSENSELMLHSPLTEEDWAILADYELEHSNSVMFQTPKGKQVKYIKADILDKIVAEIRNGRDVMKVPYDDDCLSFLHGMDKCLDIIDKHR